MKKIFLLFLFSFAFIGAFAQEESDVFKYSFDFPQPQPLATNTFTCGTLTLVITSTDLTCNGNNTGSATVTVTGGTPPYTYDWIPSGQATNIATGLPPGQPSIDVWDALGNYCNGNITITEPAVLNAVVNLTPPPHVSCFGMCNASATVTPTGGTSPYTYLWGTSPPQTTLTATGLCAGTYSFTISDANACSRVKTFFIIEPLPLIAYGSSTSITCSGSCDGTASVAPSGGNLPYTYSWSPGSATTSAISNLCASPPNYTCYITDPKGCAANYTTAIIEPPLLTVTVTGTNLLCNGVPTGSVSATASGGTGVYTYSWVPGGYTTSSVTGLSAQTYILTLKDANNCTKTATVTLTEPVALTAAPTATAASCFNQCDGMVNVNAGGGTGAYTYLWAPGGCTTSACAGLCDATYSLTVTDANACTKTATVAVTEPAVLAITPSSTPESCAGSSNGTTTASVTGGTSPYTFAWSGGQSTSTATGLSTGNYSVTVTDANNCVSTATVTVSPPSAIFPNLTSTAALCNGNNNGTATSNTSGGIPPYTYAWSGGCVTSACSNLSAGNYSVTITDAGGCTATATISVGQPASFTAAIASATPNPLNCNGDCNGTVLTNLNGGTLPYTYSWSHGPTTPSLTGLCVGGYTLNATDANGCVATTSVTFTQPAVLSATLAATNPTCFGSCNGSITANASGGTGAYTYSWLPGGETSSAITAQCARDYTVTVRDNKGCSNTQTVALTAPAAVSAIASIVNNVSCSGACDGVATAAPTGGTGAFTYLWTGGATTQSASNLCAGPVSVLVRDANGCSDIDNLNITQPSPLLSILSSATSSCNLCTGAATITTVNGTFPYTYSWSPGGQTTSTATGLCVGNYTASITDANGCTNSVTVAITSQINIIMSSSGPSVSCPGSCDASATATPSGGGTPYTYSWNSAPVQTTPSATGLCAGNYTVTITDVTGCISTKTVSFAAPAALTTTMSSTSASCGLCNGTANVAAAGGTGALTYSWSGFPVQTTATATGLCFGDYTVTVSDANNCTTSNTVTVGDIPAISDNASTTLATCGTNNDGEICVSPSGGVPVYTYLWSPGAETGSCITGLAAGIYTVTISDAFGCSSDFPIALGTTNGPTVTVTSALNPSCNADCDGAIAISATGNSPFTYLWTPGAQTTSAISALCAGTYIVQVDDNVPCTTFSTTILTDPPQMSSNPVITDAFCNGGSDGSICLSPSGGASPYTFTWSGGETTSCVTGLSAGTYTVILADANACDDTVLIPVGEPALLTVSITPTNVLCNGDNNGTATATVTGGTTLYTYAWSTGSALPGIVGLSPTTYSITVTDNNGCTATASVTISQPTALTSTISSTNMSCNSVCDGTATIAASGGTTAYLYAWLPGGQTTSAVNALCQGNYVTTVTDANGCSSTQTVAITEPASVTATVTPTNATCFGGCDGAASTALSGGTGTYTYLWNAGGLTTSAVTGLCVNSYTLTTSDANGCSTTNLFSISAPAVLQANITNTQTSCTSTCDGTASSAPVGGTGVYTYQWSNGQTTATATGLCPSTYTLTISDANGCTIAQTTTIPAPATLSQSWAVTGATCMLCNGSISVVGSGGTSPYSFFWSTGATTGTITGLCAGIYIDTVMDANGCISVDTISLSNTTGPVISLTSTNINCFGACNGTATVATATGNGPPWSYSWSFTSPTQTTQTATGLCPNQYFASVTDVNGCVTIDNVNITEPAQLVSNAVPTNATCFGICNGSLTTSATGGTGAYTYAWLPGGETTSSISSQCSGTYTLTLKDANNCSLTTTITIGQNTILTSTLTSTNNSCNAACNGTASISISGGTLPYTYAWMTGGQTTTTATGLCANNYTITVNDAVGCISINTVTITEPAVLLSNITTVNPLCNLSCNGSVSSAPTGGTSPYTYSWMPGNLTSASVTGLCAGTFTLTLRDANNCSAINTVTLTDPAVLSSTSTVTNTACANTCDGSINITPAGGTIPYTFSWSPGAQITEDVTGLCPGNYSVTITDANACSVMYTMTVNITTLVVSAAGNDTSFCVGGIATLTSASTNATSLTWYQLPAWSVVGATPTVTVSPGAGNTSYALIAMNGICSDTDTVIVTVNNYPVVSAGNDISICMGSTATLCASGASGYQWYQLPAWTPIAAVTCITVSPAVGTIDYAVIGMNGLCSDTDTVSVTVLIMPVANAGNDTAFCSGGTATLCGTLSQNGVVFNWFELPLWTPVATATCTTVSPSTTTDYGLIVSNGICSDTDTVTVTIYPTPIIDAGSSLTILSSTSIVLNGTGSGTYLWSPAAGLSSTTNANPTATPTTTTTYTLLVTDANGCTSTDSVRITIVTNVFPNDGLSPNGDGINDVWVIPGIEAFPNALIEIYNRWGELLFHSIGYSKKWDATFKDKDLPVGTYYYVINLNSDLIKDPITGPITILR